MIKLEELLQVEEIEVGEYLIKPQRNGSYLIERSDGESAEVSEEDLEQVIADYFKSVL